MPLENLPTDAIGAATISLVILLALLGLFCIIRSVCFLLWVRFRRRGNFLRLYSYFTGPSVFRITLILLSVYWGLGEISRLTFFNRKLNFVEDPSWRERICKFYLISNLGFAEPSVFLMLAFLLHAALQQGENGTLNPRWSRKNLGFVVLFCFPSLVWDLLVVFFGGRFIKLAEFFTRSYGVESGEVVCTYPLLSTIFLGGFNVILMVYVSYLGSRILTLAINKSLRRRIYILVFSVVMFLPLRALCLGLSVLVKPVGGLLFEVVVFVGFCAILCCIGVGIVILVYFPVADMSALGDPERIELVRELSSLRDPEQIELVRMSNDEISV